MPSRFLRFARSFRAAESEADGGVLGREREAIGRTEIARARVQRIELAAAHDPELAVIRTAARLVLHVLPQRRGVPARGPLPRTPCHVPRAVRTAARRMLRDIAGTTVHRNARAIRRCV